ncbi:response regulator transcription factor [Hwanghaeella sp.]|uniref:response regulator transcription factor n=1 Tax=Hwanghaeella sp. TaxID=2605943 RepID=UPI003CCC3837
MLAHTSIQHHTLEERRTRVSLTDRERECLSWLAKGLRTGRIAERFGLADVTVALHLSNARKKLGATTRDQAMAQAIMLQLIYP